MGFAPVSIDGPEAPAVDEAVVGVKERLGEPEAAVRHRIPATQEANTNPG